MSSSATVGTCLDHPGYHGACGGRIGRSVDGRDECRALEHRFAAGHMGSVAYPEAMPRLRIAAAQLNMIVGDLDGNAARIIDAYEKAEACRLRPRRVSRARAHGLPARRPAAAPVVRRAFRRGAREAGRAHWSRGGGGGLPRCGARSLQRRRGVRERSSARRLPQASAAELRGVRRAALLRAVHASTARSSWWQEYASPCRSARTRGARMARSPRRQRVAPSSS